MKTFSMSVSLLLLASLRPALAHDLGHATEVKQYQADALELADALKRCASHVGELAKVGPANSITSATRLIEGPKTVYSLEFEAGGMAPAYQRFLVGTLLITRLSRPAGAGETYACEVTKPEAKDGAREERFEGTFIRLVAIGAETTGKGLKLSNGKILELDLSQVQESFVEGEHAEVEGVFKTLWGPERGDRRVLEVHSMKVGGDQ